MHVGRGDIHQLVTELNRREEAHGASPHFVFLLQETFRRGAAVPSHLKVKAPRRIAPRAKGAGIEDTARELGWWMYYAPSMRNGLRVGPHAEDRGNAILSSLPLTGLHALELPFGVQRRVALMATVTDSHHVPLLRVVAAHLDTRARVRHGWVLGGPAARNRQARAIVEAVQEVGMDDLPLIVGADVNSHMGAREAAVQTVSALAPRLRCDKATHRSGFVLDHVFARLPDHWSAGRCERMESTFGSDHYPLALRVQYPASPLN